MQTQKHIAIFLLRISLGVFFLVLGIQGLAMHTSKTAELLRWVGRNDTWNIVISVLQILAGAVLFAGVFLSVGSTVSWLLSFVVLILWGIHLVMTLFLHDFLRPDTLSWLYKASWSFIVFASLWLVSGRD
ncbi:MAG: hypothetical protein Kow009_11980 [Spirochaetales bacterium]